MIVFTIPGQPVGKGRPRFARRGNFVTTYSPEKTANYETLVKIKSSEAMTGHAKFADAVSVVISLFVSVPASWSKKKRAQALDGELKPTTKPDLDNMAKIILDGCNGIVWGDDKQAVDLSVRKRYAETPGAVVEVRAL